MEIVARTVGNAAGLWLATRLLSGLSVPEGAGASHMWLNLLVLGLVLALVNSLIKPVAKFLTFPLYIITFGLFALVVNGAMLSLTGWLTDHIAALGGAAGTGGGLLQLGGGRLDHHLGDLLDHRRDARAQRGLRPTTPEVRRTAQLMPAGVAQRHPAAPSASRSRPAPASQHTSPPS